MSIRPIQTKSIASGQPVTAPSNDNSNDASSLDAQKRLFGLAEQQSMLGSLSDIQMYSRGVRGSVRFDPLGSKRMRPADVEKYFGRFLEQQPNEMKALQNLVEKKPLGFHTVQSMVRVFQNDLYQNLSAKGKKQVNQLLQANPSEAPKGLQKVFEHPFFKQLSVKGGYREKFLHALPTPSHKEQFEQLLTQLDHNQLRHRDGRDFAIQVLKILGKKAVGGIKGPKSIAGVNVGKAVNFYEWMKKQLGF